MHKLRMGAHVPATGILFGQASIADHFSTNSTMGSSLTLSNGEILQTRLLKDVSPLLTAGTIQDDEISVQVFFHIPMQQWAAINNRGFAVHCLAEMIPKRPIPRRPTIEEENRLKITLNGKTIQGPFPSTKVESNSVMYIDVPKSFFFK
jgi:hypothetical protein